MPGDSEKDAPSLDPPSLFRRRKKPKPAPEPAREPAPDAVTEPVNEQDSVAVAKPEPEPEPEPEPGAEPLVEAEPTAPVAPPVAPLQETAPLVDDGPTTIFDDPGEPAPDGQLAAVSLAPPETPETSEEPKPAREPWRGGLPATIATGGLVGVLVVAATAGSLHLCSAIQGTSSCGGPGFFLLLAILIVAVLVGAAMLRGARVPEPVSTSFLAVGLLSVITLLFLVGSIFEWWMIIVIPLASVATFLLSYWVTTTYVDPAGAQPEPDEHDVR